MITAFTLPIPFTHDPMGGMGPASQRMHGGADGTGGPMVMPIPYIHGPPGDGPETYDITFPP